MRTQKTRTTARTAVQPRARTTTTAAGRAEGRVTWQRTPCSFRIQSSTSACAGHTRVVKTAAPRGRAGFRAARGRAFSSRLVRGVELGVVPGDLQRCTGHLFSELAPVPVPICRCIYACACMPVPVCQCLCYCARARGLGVCLGLGLGVWRVACPVSRGVRKSYRALGSLNQ